MQTTRTRSRPCKELKNACSRVLKYLRQPWQTYLWQRTLSVEGRSWRRIFRISRQKLSFMRTWHSPHCGQEGLPVQATSKINGILETIFLITYSGKPITMLSTGQSPFFARKIDSLQAYQLNRRYAFFSCLPLFLRETQKPPAQKHRRPSCFAEGADHIIFVSSLIRSTTACNDSAR